ncbi:hypothetical protein WKR88_17690 [Trinickia caryophylli]|uniref:PXPV repeat-containing protein n=1 Tax=Trinickia caryophylli TaxID=28094 RepID=A0A1X7DXL6_TRICW|nr:hypothetical protein [Trinickia caryophylli]PMS14175.1 hypothetical protein C0Z17_01160 [Trinickia caryophylli]TRX17873.1 hypothetical protein FNF07_06295 [Trinickia caryophylli]WQE11357.1 hypothetical protein U0034_16630 [Trinickia caryophylli]SMF23558.1 hypothetical protein SAMN06295900_104207 [Trinickia caryophylli]GLU32515.1 hypothetical protein Busp01_23570 [Trinickia caryophylli]
MRWRNASLALLATAAVCLSGTAQAAHWNVGVFLGPPAPIYPVPVVPAPYYYAPYPPPYPVYPPPYYAPPVVIEPAQPDVYIERSQTAAPGTPATSSGGTWWYCRASKAYYPYVKECPGGWQETPATPPAPKR